MHGPTSMARQKGSWIHNICPCLFVINYTLRYNDNAYNISQPLPKVYELTESQRMLKIDRQTDYALQVMLALAKRAKVSASPVGKFNRKC